MLAPSRAPEPYEHGLCDAGGCEQDADWLTEHINGTLLWCDVHHFDFVLASEAAETAESAAGKHAYVAQQHT